MVLAGVETEFSSHAGSAELILAPVDSTAIGAFAVAAQSLVIRDSGGIDGGESRILVDGEAVEPTTSLGRITHTCVGTLSLVGG